MPRIKAIRLRHHAVRQVCRRLGPWLGVVALLLQLVVPLAQPQAAWVEDGLFPPTCSIHHDSNPAAQSDIPDCGACALCHAQLGQSGGALSGRVVSLAFKGGAVTVAIPQAHAALPAGAHARPPLPSRGPPAAL